jgi:hypothetical protein
MLMESLRLELFSTEKWLVTTLLTFNKCMADKVTPPPKSKILFRHHGQRDSTMVEPSPQHLEVKGLCPALAEKEK